ncbi:MAG: hypothetical protein Q8P75_00430 [bacterium]|nr:hypothetical protein [bacterium]
MSNSYTFTETQTFTFTDAKYIAAKVATDLARFRRFYNSPSLELIKQYEEELTALLKADYLDNITYGFKRGEKWIEALRYHALSGGSLVGDDDPGKIRPGVDVMGAHFTSFLVLNSRWSQLSTAAQEAFEANLPFRRGGGDEPALESGYWSHGHNYASGGRSIGRSTIIR